MGCNSNLRVWVWVWEWGWGWYLNGPVSRPCSPNLNNSNSNNVLPPRPTQVVEVVRVVIPSYPLLLLPPSSTRPAYLPSQPGSPAPAPVSGVCNLKPPAFNRGYPPSPPGTAVWVEEVDYNHSPPGTAVWEEVDCKLSRRGCRTILGYR